jgi:hypothetical protein
MHNYEVCLFHASFVMITADYFDLARNAFLAQIPFHLKKLRYFTIKLSCLELLEYIKACICKKIHGKRTSECSFSFVDLMHLLCKDVYRYMLKINCMLK